ncbi:hypothetical protein [Rhodoferax sp.]|uniref:hypothetical protein n=1 Tax=Rhodoferax sp. TaxID=50421 RepID=UPI00374DBD5F
MKTVFRATAIAAIAMVSASAFAAADFDANIELDSRVENNSRGASQVGRVELNASKKMGSKYFIAGRATYLAHPDGTAGTDDLWAQMGSDTVDIKLGRFEAANLFQTPGDVLVEYAGFSPYQANVLRGRQGAYSNGVAPFHAAVNVQLGGGLTLEIGGVSSKANGGATGLRPVLSYANGPLHLAAGVEALRYQGTAATTTTNTTSCTLVGSTCTFGTTTTAATAGVSRTGYGLTGDYNFGGVTLYANYAAAKTALGLKQNTFALMAGIGNLTVASVFGKQENPGNEDMKVTTFWAAYAIPFFDVKGATITPAVSFSSGGGSNNAKDSSGFALRVHYDF